MVMGDVLPAGAHGTRFHPRRRGYCSSVPTQTPRGRCPWCFILEGPTPKGHVEERKKAENKGLILTLSSKASVWSLLP